MIRGALHVGEGDRLSFWCPGCRTHHTVTAQGWGFDGNYYAPTFGPSVLVRGVQPMSDAEYERWEACGELPEPRPLVCHSYVKAGIITFLTDCTHPLAGDSRPLLCPPY